MDTGKGYKLRHVFDISDTNSRAGRTVPIWQMKPQCEAAVIEDLENSYGVSGEPNLSACLLETAKVIAEDNFEDYYTELCISKTESLLEELDGDSTKVWFKNLLTNGVAFMLLTRCGIDAYEHFTCDDFAHVFEFNTPESISVLGAAVSDIAGMPLREIAATVLTQYREEEKQNRTFAPRSDSRYNDGRMKSERSVILL